MEICGSGTSHVPTTFAGEVRLKHEAVLAGRSSARISASAAAV